MLIALALGGCSSNLLSTKISDAPADPINTSSTEEAGSLKETSEAGKKWKANPTDMKLGLAYASRLRDLKQTDEQFEVLHKLSEAHPQDWNFQSFYGKELVSIGRGTQGAAVLERVVAADKADWKIHSALGVAYDQQGRNAEARTSYEKALALKPGDFTVYNNFGMSYLLEGDLQKAETTFRQAMSQPGGDKDQRLRQNLALTLGLQGRYDAARDVASRDLTPEQVEANMQYLRKMLAQKDTWQQLKGPAG